MKSQSSLCNFLWRNSLIFALLGFWLVIGWLGWINEVFIPSLPEVVRNTFELLFTAGLWVHIFSSLSVILAGFSLSVFIAVPVGVIMGSYARVNSALQNFIELIRPISPLALYPLFIFLFGIGFMSKLAIVFWVSWIPLLFNTIAGVQRISERYLHIAKTLGATRTQMLIEIVFPAIIPWVITGMRLAMGSALLVIIAAEMIGSNRGIGFFILNASYTFKIVDLYGGIIVIAIIGILINAVFLMWEKRTQISSHRKIL